MIIGPRRLIEHHSPSEIGDTPVASGDVHRQPVKKEVETRCCTPKDVSVNQLRAGQLSTTKHMGISEDYFSDVLAVR